MLQPELFDILGVLAFFYITFVAFWALKNRASVPSWAFVLLLFIGIAGLLLDGTIVYVFFLKG